MRLSEAIRLGAMMKPQAFGTMFNGIGTCALGAALDAVGLLRGQAHTQLVAYQLVPGVMQLFPLLVADISCPVCEGLACYELGQVIPHLNDGHNWSREQIADWVEQIEIRAAQSRDGQGFDRPHLEGVGVQRATPCPVSGVCPDQP